MGRRTLVYLSAELDAAVRAAGLPLAELLRRGLDSVGGQDDTPKPASRRAPPSGAQQGSHW